MTRKKNILFLCTGNSCRSQMAEGWARHCFSDKIVALSAGTQTHGLNPHAIEVMAEKGVDIAIQSSEHIDTYKDTQLDVVITVCANAHETCPVFSGESKVIHAGFDDPPKMARALAEQGMSEQMQLNCYRQVRDQIEAFIRDELPDLIS